MEYRIEKDTLGEVKVPLNALWGAQTERSRQNFTIGTQRMPLEVIYALVSIKKAAAKANLAYGKLSEAKAVVIDKVCDDLLLGQYEDAFPLKVWQTGSGTQTNMNVNEVIANLAKKEGVLIHPNDDVNMSQSSNDTFPTSMHLAARELIIGYLLPKLEEMETTFLKIEKENASVLKCGRTHLQDATPLRFSQEVSGWRYMLIESRKEIVLGLERLSYLAIGGTAVGTGLNAPKGFGQEVVKHLSEMYQKDYYVSDNYFHALTSKDALVFTHGALKALACNLLKIANDIRHLASGPRTGLGELILPANEPGSSIMPGKVNPTQCEAVTMVAVQVMANDAAVAIAASQGNFELNVYMPVTIYNFLQSVRLLADSLRSFDERCVSGIKANKEKMHENLHRSLMLVTALNPVIGYEKAAKTAHKAYEENISLKEACVALGFLTPEKFDEVFHPEEMV